MLYQRTIYNICHGSKTSDEIKEKLTKKGIPFEEYGDECGVFDDKHGRVGRVAFMIDLGKINESCYAEDYFGYYIMEIDKPSTHFFYSKIES